MATQTYRALREAARLRRTELQSEIAALEAAFPELKVAAPAVARRRGRPRGRAVVSEASRLRMSEAAKSRWAQRRANAAAHMPQDVPANEPAPEYAAV